MKRSVLMITLILLPCLLFGGEIGGYLFAHMTRDHYGDLFYSASKDGLHWELLNDGKQVHPEYRGHADIIAGHDGRYYMLGNPPKGGEIRVWVSDDLIQWEIYKTFRPDMSAFTEFNPVTYWHGAPKMFYDEATGEYVVTWHSSMGGEGNAYWCNMRTLFITTKDFEILSSPKRLLPYDMGTIDVIIRKENDDYYAIIKDECYPAYDWPTGKAIRVCKGLSATGPFDEPMVTITPNFREAPTLIPKPDRSGWYLYYEQYPGKQYGCSTAPVIEGPWYSVYIMEYKVPDAARHGCMVAISETQYDAIVKAFPNSNKGEDDKWLYASFKDPGDQGIFFALSEDAYSWTALNNNEPWIVPEEDMRVMRDPFITRDPKQGFHLVWTCGNQKVGYAFSRDLRRWSKQRIIPLFADKPNTKNTWAPEMVWDKEAEQWIIFWSSTLSGEFPETDGQVENEKNHRIYALTTKDFKTFSEPCLFLDPGYPVIDASLYLSEEQVYCIFKDERRRPLHKQLRVASGATLNGPWSGISEPFTESWSEGPSAIRVGDQVMIYYDQYNKPQHMGAVVTSDFKTYEDVTDKLAVPYQFKHGSFIRITQEEAQGLLLGPVR